MTIQDRLAIVVQKVQQKFPKFILQTHTLRVEQALDSSRSSYKLSLKSGSGTASNGVSGEEVYLDQNDAFVLCGLAIGIKKFDTSFTPDRYANYQLFTYPDPQYFVGTLANQAPEYEALMTIWNGQLSFRTSNLERIKPMDTSRFLYVPETQVINAIATDADTYPGNGLTNQRLAQYGGRDWESQGFAELLPAKIIDGSEQNQFEISLGAGSINTIDGSYVAAGTQTATSRNTLVIRALGVLISDGSKAAKEFSSSWDLQS